MQLKVLRRKLIRWCGTLKGTIATEVSNPVNLPNKLVHPQIWPSIEVTSVSIALHIVSSTQPNTDQKYPEKETKKKRQIKKQKIG